MPPADSSDQPSGPASADPTHQASNSAGRPLSPEVSEQLEVVYGVIGPYLDTTLEELEIELMNDPEPAAEAMAWMTITAAWDAYHLKFLNEEVLDDDEERKIVAALVAISDGETNEAALPVEPETAARLLKCFQEITGA